MSRRRLLAAIWLTNDRDADLTAAQLGGWSRAQQLDLVRLSDPPPSFDPAFHRTLAAIVNAPLQGELE